MVALLVDIPPAPAPARGARPPATRPSGRCARPSQQTFRRRRVIAVALLLVVLLGGVLGARVASGRTGGGPLAATGAPGALRPISARVWVVRPGDTLWTIALAVDPHGDVRPLVDRLAAEIGGTNLYPGEQVDIPGA
ncbi:MAG: LysM peptidoglycan-binding domain-containing protein [Acidimicrobiales bacterium]